MLGGEGPTVIKVGGSLFDLPDLGPRLGLWLAQFVPDRVVLVPGGGRTTDVVRDLDRRHSLGDEAAHCLALRTLTINAHFLSIILKPARDTVVSGDVTHWPILWQRRRVPIVDVFEMSNANKELLDRLPHSWEVTSDSIAALVTKLVHARRLILLKSTARPRELTWEDASKLGLVDSFFARVAAGLDVTWVNFREWTPE